MCDNCVKRCQSGRLETRMNEFTANCHSFHVLSILSVLRGNCLSSIFHSFHRLHLCTYLHVVAVLKTQDKCALLSVKDFTLITSFCFLFFRSCCILYFWDSTQMIRIPRNQRHHMYFHEDARRKKNEVKAF